LRTKVVKTEDDKEPQVFVAKESTKAPKKVMSSSNHHFSTISRMSIFMSSQ